MTFQYYSNDELDDLVQEIEEKIQNLQEKLNELYLEIDERVETELIENLPRDEYYYTQYPDSYYEI